MAAADFLVVLVRAEGNDSPALKAVDRATGGTLLRRARETGFRGQEGRLLVHPASPESPVRTVCLAGLGKSAERTAESWRRAGAAAANAARGEGAARLAVFFSEGGTREVLAVAEGILLCGYRFIRYRKEENEKRSNAREIELLGPKLDAKRIRAGLEPLETIVPAVFAARDLVNEPPSIKSASYLARRAVEMCRGGAVEVEVMGFDKIRALHLEGLLAVNRGSVEEPRFVRMRYRPRGRARKKVALIGKGITFDSGGLSLKPPNSMETMKQDMAGAAAVFAILSIVGRLKPPIEVTGYVPSTDNLPSGSAQKPGDVIRYRNGKTVEVLNTDAEGRLILADALALASEEKHDVIIDLATLTGACRVALGLQVGGIMGNDAPLIDALVEIGRDAGEPLWPLPLVREYRDDLKSSVADLKNVGGGFAGAITAGLFLQEFVDGAAWAHLDIAGPAFAEKDGPYCPRGGTGFGVRTMVRYLLSL
jgi:leucyl aminopeptidase